MNRSRVLSTAFIFRALVTSFVFATAIIAGVLCLGATPMPTERERLTGLLARCHDDPDLFNSAFLARSPYWWRQVEIGNSIVQNHTTVCYTGNAVGKDYLVGGVVPWWLYTRSNSLVIVTGPSQSLLGTVTWKEIRLAVDNARFPMGAKLSTGVKTSPQTVRLPGHDWAALGYSTTNVERASGQHNRNLLVVVEEASGVEPEVWEAIDSLKAVRLFVIGNPLRAEGGFVDLIRQAEKDVKDKPPPGERVNAIRIPSTDSPHINDEKSSYGLADRTWIRMQQRKYGVQSLWYRSHVLAEIPSVSSDQLITPAWVDRAMLAMRPFPPFSKPAGKRRISCDLGEGVGRDSTAICVRDDLGVLEWVVGNTMGLAEAAEKIASLAQRWAVEHGDITYDRVGVGKDLRNHLARRGITTAVGYAGAGSPKDQSQFPNIRSEAAWKFRQRLDPEWTPDPRYAQLKQPSFTLPADTTLSGELKSLTYDLVGKQTRLITKEKLCEVLGHSPDRSDALIQSFAFA